MRIKPLLSALFLGLLMMASEITDAQTFTCTSDVCTQTTLECYEPQCTVACGSDCNKLAITTSDPSSNLTLSCGANACQILDVQGFNETNVYCGDEAECDIDIYGGAGTTNVNCEGSFYAMGPVCSFDVYGGTGPVNVGCEGVQVQSSFFSFSSSSFLPLFHNILSFSFFLLPPPHLESL